tara:strand:+ start:14477 stop:15031 length:555 start_codon:yes stop_codon:yes gene_type:complete
MAKKEEKKPILERTYIIPIRSGTRNVPFYKKSKKAISVIREFIAKHTKAKEVSIGHFLNKEVWKNGIKNPPHKLKVDVVKYDKEKSIVELHGAPKIKKEEKKEDKKDDKKDVKKEEKKTDTEKVVGKIEKKIEKKEKEDKNEAEKIEKEDIKELKKDLPEKEVPKVAPIPKKVEQKPSAPKQTE